MKELIEALQIFLEYGNVAYPTHCEHDQLNIVGYDHSKFSQADKKRLGELGFNFSDEDNKEIYSYRYGSA